MLHWNGKRQQWSYWSLCKLAIKNSLPLHIAGKSIILFIACSVSQHQCICVLSLVASGYDFTAPFSLWLSSLLFTQPAQKKKSAHHFLIPWPRSVCCASLDPSRTHHSNPPVWLSGCLSCICQCQNTWVMLSINNLISAWENQKLYEVEKKEKNYIMCREGRVPFSKREVIRQLKMVVTWSFEVHFQTSFPYIQAHTIIMDPTPLSLWLHRPLI